jgi:hypothetical protein
MSDATDSPAGNSRPWDLRLLATAYVLGVAFLHQYIYWSAFSVNILEHATLFDLAKYTVWPLFGALTTGPLVLQLIHVIDEAIDKKSKVSLVIVLLAVLVPLAITIYMHDPLAYLIGAGGAAAALYTLLVANDVDPFTKYFDTRSSRRTVLFTLIFLPLFSAAAGAWRAELVKQGKSFEQAFLPADTLAAQGLTPNQKLIYLGSTADYAFFWIDGGPTVLNVRADSISGFRLRHIQAGADKVTAAPSAK